MHPNIQVTFDSNPHNDRSESNLAANPLNADNMVGASKDFTDPATYQFSIRAYATFDGGQTWQQAPPFALLSDPDPNKVWAGLSDPVAAWDDAGNCYVVGLPFPAQTSPYAYTGLGIAVYKSTDGGLSWTVPNFIHQDIGDDKQWAAGDTNPTSPHHGNVYAVWDSPQGLAFARTTDHGSTWIGFGTQPAGTPLVASSFGPQVAVGSDGTVYVVFREGASIQFVKSTDGGDTFSPSPGTLATGITPLTSPPLASPNGFPELPGGTFRVVTLPTCCTGEGRTVVVAWADYREGVSRIYYQCSQDGGDSWLLSPSGMPLLPSGIRPGADQHDFHPQLAVNPIGQIGCAFYEFGPKKAGGPPLIDVILALSQDGTAFWRREVVTDEPWDPTVDAPLSRGASGTTFIGDYFGLAGTSLGFFPFWTDTRTGIQEIFTARSDALVPNLKDMDLREAEETIRSVSLTLKVTGVGDVVLQRPQADSVVPVGSIVQVILSNE
jgi:hypothetical protein